MLEKFKSFQIDAVKMKNVKGGVMAPELVGTMNCVLADGTGISVSGVFPEDFWYGIDDFNNSHSGNEIVGCEPTIW